MLDKKQDIHNKDLKIFGLFIAGVITAWWMYATVFQNKILSTYPLFIALALSVVSFDAPKILYYPYCVWMWFGEKIGQIMSKVILSVFFFLILVPTSFLCKIFTRDPLKCRLNKNTPSYFHNKQIQPVSQLERMF